ncbi:cilia- and flagella-associated protein 100-like isoform X4 [Scleropages formosus]|uniref:cilia- and flagella-associated protein 100-like isoform X4 n=1 Tax=Scleropages formosus TaxID=113540 RepID=UPI0010FAA31F|nr:cilia- and flagella-associated protein 100-like isoform X4 [Scleropages formosus]
MILSSMFTSLAFIAQSIEYNCCIIINVSITRPVGPTRCVFSQALCPSPPVFVRMCVCNTEALVSVSDLDCVQERKRNQELKVHEKLTYKSRANTSRAALRLELRKELEEDELSPDDEPDLSLSRMSILRSQRKIDRLHEYFSKEREICRLNCTKMLKGNEIQRLQDLAVAEERKVAKAEQLLQDDITVLQKLIDQHNKLDEITEKNLKKEAEIKRIPAQILKIERDILDNEMMLEEYNMYRDFLLKASRIQMEDIIKDEDKSEAAEAEQSHGPDEAVRQPSSEGQEPSPLSNTKMPVQQSTMPDSESGGENGGSLSSETCSSEYEEPELYFTDPQQLLDQLNRLKMENLSLLQNSALLEEELVERRVTMANVQEKYERERKLLMHQIDVLTIAIQREQDIASELEQAEMLFYETSQLKNKDAVMKELEKKVEEAYQSCFGLSDTTLKPLAMLTTIEEKVQDLLESLEQAPKDLVWKITREKERERKLREMSEKISLQQEQREERRRRRLERALADIIKPTGKKTVMLPRIPVSRTKKVKSHVVEMEDEETIFFFT